ncbi:MAG: threonylcarbamoyl-AMP synthase [Ruminococcaceae bacterium]|nr:threonylcarbamoyl-AMP synthase [Oscillospiraceae bacterium]
MKTHILTDNIDIAVDIIKKGGLVAVPTETVYGIACNGLDERAVDRIYELKGRPEVKPLSLMVKGPSAIDSCATAPPIQAYSLAKRFWPGPLTIVLNANLEIPENVRASGKTVGLRCPAHEKTLSLLEKSDLPLAAPSANPSGKESPVSAEQVKDYFDGKIDAIIDGGICSLGVESTVISLAETPFRIIRQGAVSEREIAEALMSEIKIIGVTGGSGVGKSTALSVMESTGALCIDCDAVYHELLNSDLSLQSELKEHFSDAFESGNLSRKKLGSIVFNNPEELKKLNKIAHPHISSSVMGIIREHAMNGGTLAVIDASELIESDLAGRCTKIISVISEPQNRIMRIMARDNISEEYAKERILAQKPDSYYAENSDLCLSNDGSKEEFEAKCLSIIMEVK